MWAAQSKVSFGISQILSNRWGVYRSRETACTKWPLSQNDSKKQDAELAAAGTNTPNSHTPELPYPASRTLICPVPRLSRCFRPARTYEREPFP